MSPAKFEQRLKLLKCPKHPKYKGVLKPRVKRTHVNCTCWMLYGAVLFNKPSK